MKYCSECGTGTKNSETFCPECGKRFANNKTATDVFASLSNFFKLLMDKLKSEKTKTTLKKAFKNKKLLAGVCGIFAVLIFIGVFSTILNTVYSPKNTIKKFHNSIINNNKSTFKNIIYSKDSNLKIDETSLELLISSFNENYQYLDSTLSYLHDDISRKKELSYEGSLNLLGFNELFALTIKEKNFLFTKYAVAVKPLYLGVTSNALSADIFVNNESYGSISSNDYVYAVGPLLPINADITLKSKNLSGEEFSETLAINSSHLTDIYLVEENPVSFFENYKVISLESNVPDAKVFVNDKDTGILVKDALYFGPISTDDVIHLTYTADGVNYTTSKQSPYSFSSSLDLDFSYSDYKKISSTLERQPSEPSAVAKQYIEKYSDREFIIPSSDSDRLDFKGLNPYTWEELLIARNEIVARHGYLDSSKPNLKSYFENKSWYKHNSSYTSSSLSENENLNYELIRSLEFLKKSNEKYPAVTKDYVFPNSNTIEIKPKEVTPLNDWELIIARNEIFARYGLEFSTKELMQHFKSKDWFVIDSSVGNDVQLNSIEYKNIETILDEEKRRMNIIADYDLGN